MLHQLESRLRDPSGAGLGQWPRPWLQCISALQHWGVSLPCTTVPELRTAVLNQLALCRQEVQRLGRDMRQQHHARWKDKLPSLWRDRPGVVYHWLHASGAPWGSTPILDDAGMQCTSLEAVDAAVRRYWVDHVLGQHAGVDESARWAAFLASPFGKCIPVVAWP